MAPTLLKLLRRKAGTLPGKQSEKLFFFISLEEVYHDDLWNFFFVFMESESKRRSYFLKICY